MARKQSIEIRRTLNRIISNTRLEVIARETGAWSRNRKIPASGFFWTLILGFSVGNHRTIAGLRRCFQKSIGRSVVPSAFYDRFTPNLVNFLKVVLAEIIGKLNDNIVPLSENLSFFKDILITDSTLIRLHDMLGKTFPSVWTHYMKASIKAHVVLSVKGGGLNSVKITSGSQHDGPILQAGRWMKDKLMIFDLGYHRIELFSSIQKQGGYYLGRLKENSNPRVIDDKTPARRGNEPIGIKLKEHLKMRGGTELVDVEAEFYHYVPPKNKKKGTFNFLRCRIVGVFNHKTKKYHLYVTNIPKYVVSTEQIAKLYQARWLIELLFRELKTNFRMNEIPSKKRKIVEALIYAALIGLLISRAFLAKFKQTTKRSQSAIPYERWAVIWATISPDLLTIILRPYRNRLAEIYLLRMIRQEAADPNRSRKLLPERAFA